MNASFKQADRTPCTSADVSARTRSSVMLLHVSSRSMSCVKSMLLGPVVCIKSMLISCLTRLSNRTLVLQIKSSTGAELSVRFNLPRNCISDEIAVCVMQDTSLCVTYVGFVFFVKRQAPCAEA